MEIFQIGLQENKNSLLSCEIYQLFNPFLLRNKARRWTLLCASSNYDPASIAKRLVELFQYFCEVLEKRFETDESVRRVAEFPESLDSIDLRLLRDTDTNPDIRRDY